MAKDKRPEAYTAIQARVGERIQWARELVEPNRAEFARAMGVDRSTLNKIESGTRPPSIFNVLDVAHKLRVTTDYILKGTLAGVDGEIAGMLVSKHPELAPGNRTAKDSDTYQPPRKPKQA